LIDTHDNFIYAMFDVCSLSSFRTAAISVLSYNLTTYKNQKNVGVFGVGRIGFYTTYILNKYLRINEFFCYDPSEESKKTI